MKIILGIFLVCFGSSLSFSVQSRNTNDILKAHHISKNIIKGIIPPLEDPLELVDNELVFDSENLNGTLSIVNGTIEGLSTLVDDIKINLLTLRVTAAINLANLKISSTYSTDLTAIIEELNHSVTGSGALTSSMTKAVSKIGFNLYVNIITGKVAVRSLSIDVGFDTLEINAESLALDGHLIDWELTNKTIRDVFDTVWPIIKVEADKITTELLNGILGYYTLAEIIEIIIGGPKNGFSHQ